MLKRLFLGAALLCVSPAIAKAQRTDTPIAFGDPLKGLREVKFGVTGINEHAKRCKIDEQALRDRILLPVRAYTKLRIVELPKVNLTLEVFAGATNAICVAHLKLIVSTFAVVQLQHYEKPILHTIVLFEEESLITASGNEGLGNSAPNSVESLGKKLATAWQTANP
jgi:hypothetical protein